MKLKPGNGHIPIVVGEFAYALRSALDQLVWQLALLSGKRPGNKSSFPIQSGDGDIDRQRFIHATWNLPCDAISIIKELQPYVRGKASKTHPLWQLNKLCNLDKHATIGISHTLVNIKTSGPPGPIYVRQVVTTADSHAEVSFPIGLKGDVQIEPLPPSLVVVKPDEAPGPEFTLPADGLTEIHRFVRDEVLPRFIKFFPANGAFIVGKP